MWTLLLTLQAFLTFAIPNDQFVWCNGAEPETLDPHRMSAHESALLSVNLYETLVARSEDYFTLRPGLASRWTISKDGTVYTFFLRPQLRWSNGERLTVEQVRGSLLRAIWPKIGNPYYAWYTSFIVGAEDFMKNFNTKEREKYEAKVGIRVAGKNRLEIHLKRPVTYFIDFLTQPPFSIVHPSMYEPDVSAWRRPKKFIVNGAYKLKAWRVNDRIVMERNPYYWDKDRVTLKSLVALPIHDYNVTLNLFRSKQVDWTGENYLETSLIPQLRQDPSFHILPAFGTYSYLFNVKKKPFDDVRVRRALSLAVDRKSLTEKILKGGQQPTKVFVPAGVPDYPVVMPLGDFKKDIVEAKKLLAEAGYPNEKKFPIRTLLYNTSEGHRKIAQAIQQMWKKHLGIKIQLQNQEWKVFLKEQESKFFDISRQGWIGDIPDPANFLEVYQTNDGNNHTNWGNPKFDKLIEKAAGTKNKKERFKILAKAEKIFLDELPLIPIYHYVFYGLMSTRVDGFKPNMFGIYQFRYLAKKSL